MSITHYNLALCVSLLLLNEFGSRLPNSEADSLRLGHQHCHWLSTLQLLNGNVFIIPTPLLFVLSIRLSSANIDYGSNLTHIIFSFHWYSPHININNSLFLGHDQRFPPQAMGILARTIVHDIDPYPRRFRDIGQIWPISRILIPAKWSHSGTESVNLSQYRRCGDPHTDIEFDKSARTFEGIVRTPYAVIPENCRKKGETLTMGSPQGTGLDTCTRPLRQVTQPRGLNETQWGTQSVGAQRGQPWT